MSWFSGLVSGTTNGFRRMRRSRNGRTGRFLSCAIRRSSHTRIRSLKWTIPMMILRLLLIHRHARVLVIEEQPEHLVQSCVDRYADNGCARDHDLPRGILVQIEYALKNLLLEMSAGALRCRWNG